MIWLAIRTFFSGVPKWVWIGGILLAAVYTYGEVRYSAGKHTVIQRLERESEDTKRKADEARKVANENAQHRAEEFEAQQDLLNGVIEDAKVNNGNPIDALFDSMSDTN